jgi:hypothetical protein
MPEFKVFDNHAGKYVGPAGELTKFATQGEAFDYIFSALASMANGGTANDHHLDVHDIDKNIAYHRSKVERDCSVCVKTSRTRIDPDSRMIIEAIKVWSRKERVYVFELGGGDEEVRDMEFGSFEEANRYIDRICAHLKRKRKDYEARATYQYL